MIPVVAHFYPVIRPGGGPAGYLYNLKVGLAAFPSPQPVEVVTLHDTDDRFSFIGGHSSGAVRRTPRSPLWAHLRGRPGRLMTSWRVEGQWRFGRMSASTCRLLTAYGAVVFHDPRYAWWYLRGHRRTTGQRIFIMPHSPVDVSTEEALRIAVAQGDERGWSYLQRRLARQELRIYEAVDGIIVPVLEAVESYFLDSEEMRRRFLRLAFHQIPSGVPPVRTAISPLIIRDRLGVPAAQVLVGFFGRYHEHKGFDIFLEAVEAAAMRCPKRFAFISAGEGWMRAKALPGYRDLGWLKEEYGTYLNAVDVVLAPNRHTLFDLGTLEAMSLGKVVLTSATGGNRWLSRVTEGVVTVDSASASRYLEQLQSLADGSRVEQLGRANLTAYHAEFNLDAFVRRHLDFASFVLSTVPREAGPPSAEPASLRR